MLKWGVRGGIERGQTHTHTRIDKQTLLMALTRPFPSGLTEEEDLLLKIYFTENIPEENMMFQMQITISL